MKNKKGYTIQIGTLILIGLVIWGAMSLSKQQATITGVDAQPMLRGSDLECEISTFSMGTAQQNANATWRADVNNRQHYFVDVFNDTSDEDIFDGQINGTITCTRSGSLVEGAGITCHIEGDSFKSRTSTTDDNVYYLFTTGTTKSKIDNSVWEQGTYIADNSVATTSSTKEQMIISFDDNEGVEEIGFLGTLGGNTNLNFLDTQDSLDMRVVCGEDKATAYTITFTKKSAN